MFLTNLREVNPEGSFFYSILLLHLCECNTRRAQHTQNTHTQYEKALV